MDTVLCTLTDEIFDPLSFIAVGGHYDMEIKNSLTCLRCKEPAFYRRGFKGRSACFYCVPHGPECVGERIRSASSAVGACPIGEHIARIRVIRGRAIRSRAVELLHPVGEAASVPFSGKGTGYLHGRDAELQLRTVLSRLMLDDDFSQSSTLISVAEGQEQPAVEFFVTAAGITGEHVGLMQGIWGEVGSIRQVPHGLYLNMEPTGFGILIPTGLLADVRVKNKLGSDKDIVGASLLCTTTIGNESWTRLTNADDIVIRLARQP